MELTIEQEAMTADELQVDFRVHPTGCVVTQKKRQQTIHIKKRQEDQIVANSLLDTIKFPKSEAEMSVDAWGKHVKIYLEGKAVLDDG